MTFISFIFSKHKTKQNLPNLEVVASKMFQTN